MPPFTIFHLDYIVAVLRRSPASVEHHHVTTSSCWRNSPSKLGWIGVRGTSSSWTCAELRGAVRSVLDQSDREDVRLHQPRCANASSFVLRGYVDNTLPSRCYASPWSCMCVGFFLKLLCSPTHPSSHGSDTWSKSTRPCPIITWDGLVINGEHLHVDRIYYMTHVWPFGLLCSEAMSVHARLVKLTLSVSHV